VKQIFTHTQNDDEVILVFFSRTSRNPKTEEKNLRSLQMYQHPLLLMAPRRDSTETVTSCNMQSFQCCMPNGECLKSNILDFGLVNGDQMYDAVRVICNNENCTVGQYMHAECFEQWEQTVLSYLKSIGRARSWSDKQRQQNLWTKKGYDLVYKVCGCRCGRGHIKKDLDWAPPITANLFGGRLEDEASKKKKKNKNKNQKPALSVATSTPNGTAAYQSNQMLKLSTSITDNICSMLDQQLSVSTPQSTIRGRAGSLTSSNGSSSPASSANGESNLSVSPIQNNRAIVKQRYLEQGEMYSDRIR
jgi:headcase protein